MIILEVQEPTNMYLDVVSIHLAWSASSLLTSLSVQASSKSIDFESLRTAMAAWLGLNVKNSHYYILLSWYSNKFYPSFNKSKLKDPSCILLQNLKALNF